jgi:hypothetical protein
VVADCPQGEEGVDVEDEGEQARTRGGGRRRRRDRGLGEECGGEVGLEVVMGNDGGGGDG